MTQANPAMPAAAGAVPQTSAAEEAQARFPAQVERALAYVAENRYDYGPRWRKADLSWEVTGAEHRSRGIVRVSIRFKPAKSFKGKWGDEYVDVMPDGSIAARRVTRVPREDPPWVLVSLAALSVAAAAALIPFIVFYEGGDKLYVSGRTLYMRTGEPKLAPFIQFEGPDVTGAVHRWAVKPEGTGTQLAYIKVTLINAQSGAVKVLIDEDAADLRTGDEQTHRPIDPLKRTYETNDWYPRYAVPGFMPLWSQLSPDGVSRQAITLNANEQVEGYLIFEVPAGSTFVDFRWKATDSAIVRF
jgi:hypothetical protein